MLEKLVEAQTCGLVKINNQELQIKELNGHRVVTFKEIDRVHERVEGTARRNFNENKFNKDGSERFIEGVDYFVRNSYEAKMEFNIIAPSGLTLITESGYLMLTKSLTDDLAWTVQRKLVNNYFRVTEQKPNCIEDILIASLKEMKEVKYRLQEVAIKQIETKEEIQGIRDIVKIKPRDTWRKDSNTVLRKICSRMNDYKTPKEEAYKALEQRAGCNLKTRLNNLRGRAFENCWGQSKINNLNYLDVIEDDKKLIEIYIAIVKEMAIKYRL